MVGKPVNEVVALSVVLAKSTTGPIGSNWLEAKLPPQQQLPRTAW